MCPGSSGGCLLFSEHSLSTVPGLGCRSRQTQVEPLALSSVQLRRSAARGPTCLVFTSAPQHPRQAAEIPSVWPSHFCLPDFYLALIQGCGSCWQALKGTQAAQWLCEARGEDGLEGRGEGHGPGRMARVCICDVCSLVGLWQTGFLSVFSSARPWPSGATPNL